MKILSILTCALVLAAPLSFAKTTERDIYILISKELSYMENIALYKEINHLCIENPSLERHIHKQITAYAEKVGLDVKSLHEYYLKQFLAGKSMQYRARADYLGRTQGKKALDWANEIEPKFKANSEEFMQAMVNFLKEGNEIEQKSFETFAEFLPNPYLAKIEKERMFAYLRKITLKK